MVCLSRRILIFPKGNNVDYLSMYLDVADSTTLPYGWSRYAQFSLAVANQIHNKYSIRKGILLIVLKDLRLVVLYSFINGVFKWSDELCRIVLPSSCFNPRLHLLSFLAFF